MCGGGLADGAFKSAPDNACFWYCEKKERKCRAPGIALPRLDFGVNFDLSELGFLHF